MRCTHSWVKKKLPLALDCSRSAWQAFFVVCLWGSCHQDGVEVRGEDQASVGGSVCDGSLAELRGFYSAGAACSEQGGDIDGGGIQQQNSPLFGKIKKKQSVTASHSK